jgi:uncharacterized DUF497 family protein
LCQHALDWDTEKSKLLKEIRGISFEEVAVYIQNNSKNLLDIKNNPSKNHLNQEVFIVNIDNYIYLIPFVRDDKNHNKVFLKTIYKSRKETKNYIGGNKNG